MRCVVKFLFTTVVMFVVPVCVKGDALPPPFTAYEVTSPSDNGVNRTDCSWLADSNCLSCNTYAGMTLKTILLASINLTFASTPGTLRFRYVIYDGTTMYLLGQSWRAAWLTDGELIDSWDGKTGDSSYKDGVLTCRFDHAGEHKLSLSVSLTKHASRYYVQGPRMTVSEITWMPDYVDVPIGEQDIARVDGDWVRRNVSSNTLSECGFDYSQVLKRTGENGLTVLDSYIAGLTPTNSSSRLQVNISMDNGSPKIRWEPDLSASTENRVYTIYGKTNLTDAVWHSPTNTSSRFFKVEVEMR